MQCALTSAWLNEQGVPDMRARWVAPHFPDQQAVWPESPVADPHAGWCGSREPIISAT